MTAQGIEAEGRNTEGGSVYESPVDKVDAPPSLPPTGEGLPEEIVKAIEEVYSAVFLYGFKVGEASDFAPDTGRPLRARSTLDATILHHLSAARAGRDKLLAERAHADLRIRAQRARLRELEPCVGATLPATDGRIRLLQFARNKAAECRALRREKDAALARAERAEKALEEPMRVCAQRASVIQILGYHPDMTITEAYEAAARAALSQGEETDGRSP